MTRPVFILLPSFTPTGPVKGAFALANILVERFPVTVVALKPHPAEATLPALSPRVHVRSLATTQGWRNKLAAYRTMLTEARETSGAVPASLSMSFSADVVNAISRRHAYALSSIRSNLRKDYAMSFGWPGFGLALTHYLILNSFERVVAMTRAMAGEAGRFLLRTPVVIGNFVDEDYLERYRSPQQSGPLRFLFLGSLTNLKQPLALIDAMAELARRGVEASLELVGKGPLENEIRARVELLQVGDRVTLHGHQADPYGLLARADVMVLPSLTEGLSRACLEALFLGVPCVARDVDGNGELITEGENGALFRDNGELADSMLRAAALARARREKACLLPARFRLTHAEQAFAQLLALPSQPG